MALVDEVAAALLIDDPFQRDAELRRIAADEFIRAYHGDEPEEFAATFAGSLTNAWMHTTGESSAERIATMIQIAARNAAALDALKPGVEVEWITMRDDDVRELHVPMDGVRQRAGQPFIVGGTPLLYPGQPVGPPEVWINCRCRLSPTAVAAAAYDPDKEDAMSDITISTDVGGDTMSGELSLVAVSDTPWSNFTASDYTIEQWRRACLLKMPGGDPDAKSTYKLPVREPNGALNRNGVHAAAAALGGARTPIQAPPEAIAAAKRKLRGLYSQLGEEPPDSLKADALTAAYPPGLSPPGTHDAPGWITNPRETQRLRTYWTKGEGALKIRWGQPGDFDRCRRQLRKYVPLPADLAGTCANLHFVALGFWPGQGPHASAEPPDDLREHPVTQAFAAAAALDEELPPLEWFQPPSLTAATPATMEDDHYFGHLATWGTCHVGIEGACTQAPHSVHDYAYFRTGEMLTAGGPVPVGQITMDTGHAAKDLGPTATVAHYDDTGTVVADVAVGEDDYGIWFNGMLRPGITDAQRRALRAGAISGDWRRIGGNLELVAALVVNVPGFPVPRVQVAASVDMPTALVAAAIVIPDPNAVMANTIATLVVNRITTETTRRERAARLRDEIHRRRVAALTAAAQ